VGFTWPADPATRDELAIVVASIGGRGPKRVITWQRESIGGCDSVCRFRGADRAEDFVAWLDDNDIRRTDPMRGRWEPTKWV
jgi:hypothetical protein